MYSILQAVVFSKINCTLTKRKHFGIHKKGTANRNTANVQYTAGGTELFCKMDFRLSKRKMLDIRKKEVPMGILLTCSILRAVLCCSNHQN